MLPNQVHSMNLSEGKKSFDLVTCVTYYQDSSLVNNKEHALINYPHLFLPCHQEWHLNLEINIVNLP